MVKYGTVLTIVRVAVVHVFLRKNRIGICFRSVIVHYYIIFKRICQVIFYKYFRSRRVRYIKLNILLTKKVWSGTIKAIKIMEVS